jgi:hypothetical protein
MEEELANILEPEPIKKTYKQRQEEIYETITKYPYMDKAPIRYPKTYKQPTTTDPFPSSVFHDVIRANLNALVPNIELGYHSKKYSPEELKMWVEQSKEYARLIYREFQEKCNNQIKKITKTEDQKRKCQNFDISKIDKLPEDVVRHIFDYLLPETKIAMYLCKYPHYNFQTINLSAANLKSLQKNIQTYMEKVPPNKVCCTTFYTTTIHTFKSTTKRGLIDKITYVFEGFKTAKPRTPGDHIYFQKKALQILKTIIYFGSHFKQKKIQRRRRIEE